jgi:hypothetical protein
MDEGKRKRGDALKKLSEPGKLKRAVSRENLLGFLSASATCREIKKSRQAAEVPEAFGTISKKTSSRRNK